MDSFSIFLNNLNLDKDPVRSLLAEIKEFDRPKKRAYVEFYRRNDGKNLPSLEDLEALLANKISQESILRINLDDSKIPKLETFIFDEVHQDSTEIFVKPEPKTIFDAIDIFYNSKISMNVPYIEFKNEKDSYTKIHHLNEQKIKHFRLKIEEKWSKYVNTIFMIVWPNPEKITNDNTVYVTYTLHDNVLDYSYVGNYDPVKIIKDALNLNFEKTEVNNQSWSMNMTRPNGLNIYTNVLAHIITNYNFKTEHYIDEFDKPFDQKKIFKFHYINSNLDNTSINLKQGKDYLILGCINVPNLDLLKKDLTFLLSVYLSQEKEILNEYSKFNVKFEYDIDFEEKIYSKNLDALQSWGRQNRIDIFDSSNGYATKCQGDRKPVITEEPDDNKTIVKFNFINDRSETVEVNMKCENTENIYPGLNKDKVPCCFKNIPVENKRKKINTEKVTSGFLEPGKVGTIFSNLEKKLGPMKRLGILGTLGKSEIPYIPENMTLISCIINYLDLKVDIGRVMKILRGESKTKIIYPYVFMQELYDHSAEEIQKLLKDPDLVVDSRFIRGLEIIFNVNIFIFEEKNKNLVFEIPRHKNGYIKVRNDNPSVLIYKNKGSNSEQLKNEIKYELLFSDSSFDTQTLFNLFESYLNTYIINLENVSKSYLSEINYVDLFEIVGQTIDESGKLSSLLTENGFAVECLPSAPLNLPIYKESIFPTESQVVEFFDENYTNKDDNGVYYNIGEIKNALYIRTKKLETKFKLESDYDIYLKTKRNAEITLFLLRWCLNYDPNKLPDIHEDYFFYSKNELDFSKLKRKLPKLVNLNEKIKFLKPTGMTNGKQFTLSKNFVQKAIKYIQKYIPLSPERQNDIYIPAEIWYPNIDKYKIDLGYYFYNVFVSETIIENKFLKDQGNPYILEFKENFILVQPVKSVYDGIEVSKTWAQKKVNKGYLVDKKITNEKYVLYKGSFDLIDRDHTSGDHHLIEMGIDDLYVLLPL